MQEQLFSVFSVDGDPHFIIQIPEKDDAICFNIDEDPGHSAASHSGPCHRWGPWTGARGSS